MIVGRSRDQRARAGAGRGGGARGRQPQGGRPRGHLPVDRLRHVRLLLAGHEQLLPRQLQPRHGRRHTGRVSASVWTGGDVTPGG